VELKQLEQNSLQLALTLTLALLLDLERQDLFASAVVEEILHGL
jgi:hypothetical protein